MNGDERSQVTEPCAQYWATFKCLHGMHQKMTTTTGSSTRLGPYTVHYYF